MSRHTPRTRDAALRRLASSKRWLIAASAALTGIFTAVAANAFPGHTLKSRTATSAPSGSGSSGGGSSGSSQLESPAQAPESGAESSESAPGAESSESVPGAESATPSESTPESSEPETTAPESSTQAEAPVESQPEAPVVSGGS